MILSAKHAVTPASTIHITPLPLNCFLNQNICLSLGAPNSNVSVSNEPGLLPDDLCALSASAPATHTTGPITSDICIFVAATVSPPPSSPSVASVDPLAHPSDLRNSRRGFSVYVTCYQKGSLCASLPWLGEAWMNLLFQFVQCTGCFPQDSG